MKDRDDKLDIGVVTDTVDRIEPTGLAEGILLRSTLKSHNSHRRNGVLEADINLLNVDRVLRPSLGPCPS
jgi:hypothetical protein